MIRETISDAQWAAGRALVEGEPSTHARVAACMGVHTTTVSHRASEDGWKSLDFRHPRVRAAQAELVELAARARNGEALDRPARRADQEDDPEGWEGAAQALPVELEPLPDEGPLERLARIGDNLSRRVDAMLRRADGGRPLEGRQVAALSALAQAAERIAALVPEEAVQEREKRSDAELADATRRIDERIVCLAREYARELLVKHGMSKAEAEAALPPEGDEA